LFEHRLRERPPEHTPDVIAVLALGRSWPGVAAHETRVPQGRRTPREVACNAVNRPCGKNCWRRAGTVLPRRLAAPYGRGV